MAGSAGRLDRRLGVRDMLLLANIGMLQNIQPLGIRGHYAVFDAIVNLLDEMTGAACSAMQVALLGCAGGPFD